jgi:hypothetical protein
MRRSREIILVYWITDDGGLTRITDHNILCAEKEVRRDSNHRQEIFHSFLHIKNQYISITYEYVPRNWLITLQELLVKRKKPQSQHLVFA